MKNNRFRNYRCQDSHVNVFHHFELSSGSVVFWYTSGADYVDEFAQYLAILDVFLQRETLGEFISQYSFHPFLGFLLLLGVSLGSELCRVKQKIKMILHILVYYTIKL